MLQETVQVSAEDQRKWLLLKAEECMYGMQNSSTTTDAGLFCEQRWDGIMCWPRTIAGRLSVQPCAHYFAGFDLQANASKLCMPTGDWYQNEGTPWTNYTQCFSNPTITVPVNFSDIDSNPLISEYMPTLKCIARVGYAVSLFTLVVAFCILATIKKLRCPRNMLHLHLFVSFIMRAFMALLKDVIFVEGVGLPQDVVQKNGSFYFSDENSWLCKTVTSVWQYSIMANYSWILMEGMYLHNLIFLALFSDTSSITLYVVLGWGMPAGFVLPWIVARALTEDTLCWTTNKSYLFLLIRVPTAFSIILNFILFLNIVRVLLHKLRASTRDESRPYRRWAKSTLVLVPLFGVHYMLFLGMSYSIGVHPGVEIVWLFCDQLFASFQGFFVAVLYCFMNGEVRVEMKRYWPRSRSLHGFTGIRGIGGRGFFSRPLRPAQCYSSTSCTSLSMGPAAAGCLNRKMRPSYDIGINGSKRLPASFVGPHSDSRYSCVPNASEASTVLGLYHSDCGMQGCHIEMEHVGAR